MKPDLLQEPQGTLPWYFHINYLLKIGVRIITWMLILFLVIWIYDAVGNRRYASRIYVPEKEQYQIVAFGDSLVEGLGSEHMVGFVGRLEQATGVPIYNAGIRRSQTTDLLDRLETDALQRNPKVVILVVGGNDIVRLIPRETTYGNLEKLFDQLRSRGITVLFPEITSGKLFDDYNRTVQALADHYGVIYIPDALDQVFWTISKKFDPLHPDDAGYELLAQRILPYLQQALIERSITSNEHAY